MSVIVRLVALIGLAMVVGCAAPLTSTATQQPAALATSSPTGSPLASPSRIARFHPPLTFLTSAQQARMVATLVAFLDAYNAGRVDEAIALTAADVAISDCDYRAVRLIAAKGTEPVRQWLRERAADHDQLILESIRNDNPDPTTGSDVVGITFTRRTSDTLRSLGFADGIAPGLTAKVVFTFTDDRIRAFGNGPGGGSAEVCRPSS